MKKYYCDACGRVIEGRVYPFNPLKHITEDTPSYIYVNGDDIQGTSGITEDYDLCLSCYNGVYGQAYKRFTEIQETF